MTSATQAHTWSLGRTIAVAVLSVIAVLAIIAAVLYFTEPARSLPSVLGTITHPASRADAHRSTRGAVAIAVAVVLVIAAGVAARMGRASRR